VDLSDLGALLLLSILVMPASWARVDPLSGRIRMLHIGDAFNRHGFAATFFFSDPRISSTPVPAEVAITGYKDAQRYYRMYLPRSERDVRENVDVVCIAGAFQYQIGRRFLEWTRDAVIEDGVGFLMADDPASFGGTGWRGVQNNWAETPVGVVLPVECATNSKDWSQAPFKVDIVLPDHPLVKGLPWDETVWIAHNRVYDRQGAVVVARTRSNPPGLPALAYMDVGRGRSVALDHDWGGRAGYAFVPSGAVWEWAPHFFCSLVYYAAQLPIPDPVLDKAAKEKFAAYRETKTLVLSVIEFADKFNANTAPLLRKVATIDEARTDAERMYIEMDLVGSSRKMDELISKMKKLLDEAMKVKDSALLWVYTIEWLSVTGTSLLCGYVLYMLMIRRKLFREVGATRLA